MDLTGGCCCTCDISMLPFSISAVFDLFLDDSPEEFRCVIGEAVHQFADEFVLSAVKIAGIPSSVLSAGLAFSFPGIPDIEILPDRVYSITAAFVIHYFNNAAISLKSESKNVTHASFFNPVIDVIEKITFVNQSFFFDSARKKIIQVITVFIEGFADEELFYVGLLDHVFLMVCRGTGHGGSKN